jgi:signal transduction histidine kinase
MKRDARDIVRGGVLLFMILFVSVLHYATPTEYLHLHEIYQRGYYIPIILAAFWYGPFWGLLSAALTSVLYGIHIHRDWIHVPTYSFNQYAEIFLYNVIALLIGFLSLRERRHREKLEKTSDELSRAYQRLRSAFEQLKQSDRLAALGQLSAGIAHEIRNPLGSIKGSIEILETEIAPDNPKQEFVRIIKEETARLNSIIAEFLKFARPPKPAVEPSSLNELVLSTLMLLQKEAEHSGVEIRRHLDPALPEIKLDRDQIRQVLLNVVLNGIQAMPHGGVLEIRSTAGDKGGAVIEISDNGPGMDEKDLDHIFDPFFTTKPQGTGLGLSISYQLIQNHGGRISARNNPARGMAFQIELPTVPPLGPA